jgi:hypothetical protein
MRVRMNGGVIGPTNPTTASVASGVYSVVEAQLDKQSNLFPVYQDASIDTYFNRTRLLVHGDGSLNANNNTIIDTIGTTMTRAGTTTQGTFSPYSQTGWSSYFRGVSTSNFLTVPNINFSTNALTVEGWFYPLSISGNYNLWGTDNGSGSTPKLLLYINSGNLILETGSISGSPISVVASTYLSVGKWYHIAIVRTGIGSGQTALYINGVSVGTGTVASLSGITATFNVGYIGEGFGIPWYGYISNFRVVNGVAGYTGNFTVPTSPLSTTQAAGTNIAAISSASSTVLLTCNSNRHVDSSPSNATISSIDFYTTAIGGPMTVPFSPFAPTTAYGVSAVGGSVSAIATSDAVTGTLAASPGTGDFSIEFWLYPTSFSATTNVGPFGLGTTNAAGSLVVFWSTTTTTMTFRYGAGGAGNDYNISFLPRLNSWTHYAYCRSGGVTSVYVNGVLTANTTTAISGTPSVSATAFTLFAQSGLNQYLGYIAGFRYVSGSSVYTSAFTPPTAPVASTGGTVLLLNGTNGAIYDSTAKNNIVTSTGGFLSTTQSKFGGSSIRYPGGAWHYTHPGPLNTLGIGEFTIEFWIWFDGMGSQRPLSQGTYAAGEYLLIFNGDGSADWGEATTSRCHTTAGSVTAGAWYHFAIVRSGLTTSVYINGTQNGTTYTPATNYDFSGLTSTYIGGNPSTSSQTFAGYIDDLRITAGVARYTTNFSVPSTSYGNQ